MTTTRTPRKLVAVTPYVKDDGAKRCKVEVEGDGIVPLHSLTRPELQAAAKLVFPAISANVWLRFKSEEIQDLVRNNDPEAAEAAVTAKMGQSKVDAFKVAETDPGILTGEKPPREAARTADLDPEENALIEAFRASRKGVDLDQVKGIVAEEVKRQVLDLGVTRVEVKLPDHDATMLPEQAHRILPEVIQIMATGCNLFLVGPAGSGKSTLAHQAADALGIAFYALSLGPTTPTSKLFGYMDAQGRYVRTPFREAYEKGGVILLDELDNGHPGLVAEINQATANGYCAFADGMVQRHADCRIVATGNTFGRGPDRLFVGRNILDAATLDRFVTVEVEIDERLEASLARGYATVETAKVVEDWIGYVCQVRRKASDQKLPVVVSPRSAIEGAKLLAAGLTMDRVKEIRLFAGIGNDVRQKIQ